MLWHWMMNDGQWFIFGIFPKIFFQTNYTPCWRFWAIIPEFKGELCLDCFIKVLVSFWHSKLLCWVHHHIWARVCPRVERWWFRWSERWVRGGVGCGCGCVAEAFAPLSKSDRAELQAQRQWCFFSETRGGGRVRQAQRSFCKNSAGILWVGGLMQREKPCVCRSSSQKTKIILPQLQASASLLLILN